MIFGGWFRKELDFGMGHGKVGFLSSAEYDGSEKYSDAGEFCSE